MTNNPVIKYPFAIQEVQTFEIIKSGYIKPKVYTNFVNKDSMTETMQF